MSIKQIKVGFDNFSYIIFDLDIKKAGIVDPGFDIKKQIDFLKLNNLDLIYIINTHHHSDHTDKNRALKKFYPKAKITVSEANTNYLGIKPNLKVSEDVELSIGKLSIKFLLTPGHTPDGLCIIVDNKVILTGDTLFIDDCGRADLSGGNIKDLFNNLQRIKKLPDKMIIYPGHDYGSKPFDSLSNQKKTNKALITKNMKEFYKI